LPDQVSVIIPVFNGEAFLAAAIETALDQTLAPHEVIVLDDGSTDGSAAVARRYPVVLVQQENRGLSIARNVAIERSTGNYLALLDCDDLWTETKLAEQVEALKANSWAGYALGFQSYLFEGDKRPEWFKRTQIEDSEPGYSPSCWMIRRATWQQVGPFDPNAGYGEDVDWLTRANDLGVRFVMIEKVLLLRRIHADNITGRPEVRSAWLRVLRASAARKRAMGQG
jgi:glycosyltransferase involved in cell wall biosynthesis